MSLFPQKPRQTKVEPVCLGFLRAIYPELLFKIHIKHKVGGKNDSAE